MSLFGNKSQNKFTSTGGLRRNSRFVATEIQSLEQRVYLSTVRQPHGIVSSGHTPAAAYTVNLSEAATHAARNLGSKLRNPSVSTARKVHASKPNPTSKPKTTHASTPHSATSSAQLPTDATYSVAIQQDGKVLALAAHAGGGFAVTRHTADGKIDKTFGHHGIVVVHFDGGKDIANAVIVDDTGTPQSNPDFGKIFVAGSCASGFAIARLMPNGLLDKSFGNHGKVSHIQPGRATSLLFGPEGRVVVGGSDASGDLSIRLTASGKKDLTFGKSGIFRGSLNGGVAGGTILRAASCGCGGGGCCTGGGTNYNPPSVSQPYGGPTFNITEGGSFSASGSISDQDPNARWTGSVDYGDGYGWQPLTLSGNTYYLSRTYSEDGTYGVNISVTNNDDGKTGSNSATVIATEPLPQVTVNGGSVVEGNTFTSNGSFSDPNHSDGGSYSATVDYGDGTGAQNLSLNGWNFTLSHAYFKVGTFPVKVTISSHEDTAVFSNAGSANVAVSVPPAPALPTSVAATALSGTEIAVTWTAGGGSGYGLPDSYIIQRSQDGGESFEQVGSVDQNHTLFLDSGLTPGKTYQYAVWSSNGGGQSAPPTYNSGVSNVTSATTLSTDTSGYYKITSVGTLSHPSDGYTVSGSLNISNSGWIRAGSPQGAMLQGVGGTLSVSETGQSYTAGASGALMPTSSGFGFDDSYGTGTVISYNSGSVAVTTTESPVAALGPASVYGGDTYTLALTSPGVSGGVTGWSINWGDGSSVQNVGNVTSVTHTYTQSPSNWTINVTATGTNNTQYSAPPVAVQVLHTAPVLTMSGDAVAAANHAYALNLTSSESAGSSVSSWLVNWGDGSGNQSVSGSSAAPTHTYNSSGSYTVTATANDSAGTFTADPVNVAVIADPGAVPVYLKAAAVGGTIADVAWSTPSDPSSTFTIKELVNGGYVAVGTAGAGAKSYQVTGLSPNTSYTFRVDVSGSNSGSSNTTSVTTLAATTLYFNDFQNAVASEWSSQQVSITPVGARNFLGEFGNNSVTLGLSNLPQHVGLNVSFDLYVIRSWDGSDTLRWGPDQWKLSADGTVLLDTTFSNHQIQAVGSNNGFQNYPDAYGSSSQHLAMYGSTEQNTLGYMFYRTDLGKTIEMDSVYHITENFAHSAASLSLVFQALGLQGLSDESWGIDNVQVVAQTGTADNLTATASPSLPSNPTTGPITLRWVNDTEGATNFEIDRSTDGVNFSPIGTVGVQSAVAQTYADNTVQPDTKYYYKVHAIYGSTPAANSNIASATSAASGANYGEALDSVIIPVLPPSGQTSQWWSNSVQSTIVLTAGVHYELIATGDFHLGGSFGRADAEYAYNPTDNTNESNSVWPDHNNFGIGVNDVGYPTIEENHAPYWGAYSSSHVYMIDVVGTGQKLTFNFHDNYYWDNLADDQPHLLQVQIYQHMPAAPSNLVATPDTANSRIQLTWVDNATDETGFRVERSTNGTNFTLLQTINTPSSGRGGTVLAYDTTATPGSKYYYRVYAITGTEYSTDQVSNVATATLGAPAITITSTPASTYQLPGPSHPAQGTVSPGSISVTVNDTTPTANVNPVTVTLPSVQTPPSEVDVFLLLDNTGSFSGVAPTIVSGFQSLVSSLTTSFPNVSFGFGVGKFEDYNSDGGGSSSDRPFTLEQPIVTPNTFGFQTAMSNALNTSQSGGYRPAGGGGDLPESVIEGLYQTATGAGFDGNQDGSNLDSGTAGSATVQASTDLSGDVPPFSSYSPGMSGMLPAAGTIGGAGFRNGALPIILVAGDSGTAYNPEGQSNTIAGSGAQVPLSSFQAPLGTNQGSAYRTTVPPGAATIQNTVTALNAIGARVIGLEDESSYSAQGGQPRNLMQAMAELTGAINRSGETISSGDLNTDQSGHSGSQGQGTTLPIAPGQPLYFGVHEADSTTSTSVLNAIGSAVTTEVANQQLDLDATPSDPNVAVADAQGVTTSAGSNGLTGSYSLTFNNNAGPRSFDLLFTRHGTGDLYGSIPVTINVPYIYHLSASDATNPGPYTYAIANATGPTGATLPSTSNIIQVNGAYELSWLPTQAGVYTFDVTASTTGSSPVSSQPQHVTVTVSTLNSGDQAPVLAAISTQTLHAGATYTATASATDPDGPSLKYYLLDPPQGMTIDPNSGAISWTPTASQVGTQHVTLEAMDGAGGLASETVTITVTAPVQGGTPLTVVSTAPDQAIVGRLYGYNIVTVDSDPDPRTFSLVSGPTGLSIDQKTGSVAWMPTAAELGINTIEVNITDSAGTTIPYSFNVTVAQVPQAPTLSTVTAASDKAMWLSWSDADSSVTGYNIYRSESQTGPFSKINSSPVTQTSFLDTGLTAAAGTTYFYYVTSFNGVFNVESAPSAQLYGPTALSDAPPAVPTNLTASGYDDGVVLNWTANTEHDLAGYLVYRAFDSSPNDLVWIQTLAANKTSYTDTSVPPGTSAWYGVRAIDLGYNTSDVQNPLAEAQRTAYAPNISSVSATADPSDARSMDLIATATDPHGSPSARLTYSWSVVSGPSGAPPVAFSDNGSTSASHTVATFGLSGQYDIRLQVNNSADVLSTVDTTVTVAQVESSLAISPTGLSIATHTAETFNAVVNDQFGNAMPTPQTPYAVQWSVLNGQGTIVAESDPQLADYTSGTANETVQATLTIGGRTLTVQSGVSITSPTSALLGVYTRVQPTAGTAFTGIVGRFSDQLTGTVPSDYTATVDWGDGSAADHSGTGGTLSIVYQQDPGDGNYYFYVSGSHTYTKTSSTPYTIRVSFDHTATGRAVAVASQAVVSPAPISATANAISGKSGVPVSGVVLATFTDPAPASASDYEAQVAWGDGTSASTSDSSKDLVVQPVQGGTAEQFQVIATHTFVIPGTATYYLSIGNPHGGYVTVSGSATIATAGPAVPSNFQASGMATGRVYLSWQPDPDVSQYVIWRSGGSTGSKPVRIPADPTEVILAQTDSNGNNYDIDENLEPNTSYTYQIQAIDEAGNPSGLSASVTAITYSLPAAPVNVTALDQSATRVELTWTNTQDPHPLYGWDVLRSTSTSGPFTSVLKAGQYVTPPDASQATVTFDDLTASPGTRYYYEVVAYRQEAPLVGSDQWVMVPSVPSAPVSATSSNAVPIPPAPTNLAGGYAGQGRVGLQWTYDQTSGLLGFDIYRYTGQGANDPVGLQFVPAASLKIGSQAVGRNGYTDDNVAHGNYYYRVIAVADDGNGNELYSVPSAVAEVDVTAEPTVAPAPPTNLQATDLAKDHVSLAWQDNSLTEVGFDIYRKDVTAGGSWQKIDSVTADSTSYTDTTTIPSEEYQYFVTAINDSIQQSFVESPLDGHSSNQIDLTTPTAGPAPAAPQNLVADPDISSVQLQWAAPTNSTVAVAGYYVYRNVEGTSAYVRVGTVTGSTAYTDSQLSSSTGYNYRVMAYSAANSQSAAVTVSTATTAPASDVPQVVIDSPTNFAGVSVDWASSTSTDGRLKTVTPVKGIIDDLANHLQSWSLVLHPLNASVPAGTTLQDIPIASASSDSTNLHVGSKVMGTDGVIAQLDPSLYPTGTYDLNLSATYLDSQGQVQTVTATAVEVSLASNIKLGNLTLPFTDLTVNVPGGQPLTVGRVYDSQDANVLGDFGYGWKLDDSSSSTNSTMTSGSSDHGSANAPDFRAGDVVYITLPGGEQHAFQFWPVPDSYHPSSFAGTNPYDPVYQESSSTGGYTAQFVCVDGSGATLIVAGDIHSPAYQQTQLDYDLDTKEAYVPGGSAYGPAVFGNVYQVKTVDGRSYQINATTGAVQSMTDPQGNVTSYASDGTGPTEGGYKLKITPNADGTISKISVTDSAGNDLGESVSYTYSNQNLNTFTDPVGNVTSYGYVTGTHYLNQVIDPRGVPILNAAYDSLNELTSLTDAFGKAASVGTGSLNSSGASQGITDPAGNATESIYDPEGDVTRSITTLKDASGNITGYSVNVTNYNYIASDITGDLFSVFVPVANSQGPQPGTTNANALQSVQQYQSFTVSYPDPTGLRYTEIPTSLVQETDYYNNFADPAATQQRQLTYVGTDSSGNSLYRVDTYSDFVLGKPQKTTEQIDKRDASGNLTPYGPASQMASTYDADGNLTFSQDAGGNQTYYVYTTNNQNGLPNGLLLRSYKVNAGADPNNPQAQATTTLNDYYTSADSVAGALAGKVRYTIDANQQETYYAYDSLGRTILSYTLKTWTNSDGSTTTGWVGTTTRYDALGRATATYQGVYLYGGAKDAAGYALMATSLDGNGHVQVAETAFSGFNGGSPLLTSQTAYTPGGQVDWSSDQYGAVTRNTYDAKGNLVRTLYPDGTEMRSVYDADGRVIWQTDRYKSNTTYNTSTGVWTDDNSTTALATNTVYDSAGRVIATYRMNGTLIVIGSDTFTTSSGTVHVPNSSLSVAGTQVSLTSTVYNDAGQTAETDSPSGLRTGSLYYPNGQVQYTGPLLATAPSNWYDLANPTQYFASKTQYLYNQAGTVAPFIGLLYDRVIDANGHHTDTYKDALGRVIFTAYDDGSYTESVYSRGGVLPALDLSLYANWLTFPAASSGWVGTPDANGDSVLPPGWSATVQVVQHNWVSDGPLPQQTFDVYDAAGNLVDVFQPAVTVNGQQVNPRWQYTFNTAGNETSQIDPNTHTTGFQYDEFGHQVSRTLPEGQAGGLLAGQQTEKDTFDAFGRVQTHTDFDGNMTLYVYDDSATGDGRIQAEYRYAYAPAPATNPSPFVVPAGFDPENPNPSGSGTHYPNYSEKTTYSYDSLGRQSAMNEYTYGNGTPTQFTQYTYDPVTGKVATITTPQGQVNYQYDPVTGNKVRMWTGTDPAHPQNDTAYAYDPQGRLTNVYSLALNGTVNGTFTGIDPATHNPTFSGTPITVGYGYDLVGNLTSQSQPGGLTTKYTLNGLNRLTDVLTSNASNTPVFHEQIDLNLDGTKNDVIDTRYTSTGGIFSQTTVNWTYDALDRLTDETLTVQSGGSNAPSPYHDHFVLDAAGNRVEEDADTNNDGTYDQKVLDTYNKDDQLTLEETDNYVNSTNPVTTNPLLQYKTSYGYNNDGFETSRTVSRPDGSGESDTYTPDLRGRMQEAQSTVTSSGGQQTSSTSIYGYDTDGVRVSETTKGTSTYFLNDPNNPTGYAKAVQEMSTPGGTPARSYLIGITGVEAQQGRAVGVSSGPTDALVLLHDGHGSTRALIDVSTGSVQEQYDYSGFGDLLAAAGNQSSAAAALTPWLFAGDGLYDPGSGWTYNLARWRDGFRFTSMDSRLAGPGDLSNANLELYSGGNPVNLLDPSGHISLVGAVTTMGILGFLGGLSLPATSGAQRFTHAVEGAVIMAGITVVAFELLPALAANAQLAYAFATGGATYAFQHPADVEEEFEALTMYSEGEFAAGSQLPESFANQAPEELSQDLQLAKGLGVTPISPNSSEFDQLVEKGEPIKWAVLQNGELRVMPAWVDGQEIPHTVLSNGENVLAAGEADIARVASGDYYGIEISNQSGHFLPSPESLKIATDAFARFGITFRIITKVGG